MSAGEACDGVATRSVFNDLRFWAIVVDRSAVRHAPATGPRAIFDGSNFNANPHELQVAWRSVYNLYIYLSLFTENGSNYTVIAKQTAGLNKFNYTIMQLLYNAWHENLKQFATI